MRSPVLAMVWENWRLTRLEAAHRLSLGIVGGSAVLVWFAAVAPKAPARDFGATIALGLIILVTFPLWVSIAKHKGGRFLDGYRPGFPLHLLYPRPVRTAVLVGVPMAYQAALGAAVYLLLALVLRFTFDHPFPLLSVAASIAAVHLAQAAGDWSTRSKVVQWLERRVGSWPSCLSACIAGSVARNAVRFSPGDALIAAIGLASFGVAVAGVARQRRGDGPVAMARTAGSTGFPEWLVTLFRFRCPISSATRAQVWFDLKSSGLPVLAIGVALAIVNPTLFVVSRRIDALLSGGFYSRPFAALFAITVAVFSAPAVLIIGGNAFGIRARQGRTYASAFEATQASGTARMAGLKVLVRSVCVLAALIAVSVSLGASLSFTELGRRFMLSNGPLARLLRAIEAVGPTGYQQFALAVVTSIGVAVMVGSRAALGALRARYPRRLNIAGSLLLLHGFVLVLLALAGQRGYGFETLRDTLLVATSWIAAAAMVLATAYLVWSALAERLLTLRSACGAVLVSAVFGAAWVTVVRAAGVPLAGPPTTDAVWMLSPELLPLTISALAPWSLSRVRHT